MGEYFLRPDDGAAFVQFGGKQWEGLGETFHAHLMIDSELLDEVTERSTVLSGRTLD